MVQRGVSRSSVRISLLCALLLILGLFSPGGGTLTAAGADQANDVGAAPGTAANQPSVAGKNPGKYSNPLKPEIPDDGVVGSCADPTVIRGQEPDTTWYMYCTTDPLNDEDLDAEGNLVFHRIPVMTSKDLVNWTYAGDAFDQLPDWAERDAALWAPEVTYSTTHDQYYMFFGVTDTTAEVSGVENCDSDNAIGVATSDSPTGPWDFAAEPVVAPRQNGPGCDFLWTYDPDVLGNTVTDKSTLYYGSYYGGVFGTELTLTGDGATVDEAQAEMVAIDNKYEGTNVIYRDGHYYMFVSATNCCNGALTGYSVFVGRSTSPLGPFVDQHGNKLTDPQAGGTPFLTMNGNRWVGTGHNTVFQDAAGDWWTIYHAVDQEDPFFETAPGFTKRPALLDAIDWIDGWPTVNSGHGPSDSPMPAPAGQEGETSRHKAQPVKTQVPHELLESYSDDFNGNMLDDAWSWEWSGEEATAGTPPQNSTENGVLSVKIQAADLHVDVNNAYVLSRNAPKGDYVVETKVRVNVPDAGCCFNYAQAGVLAYGDEDNYLKLTNTSIWNTRQTEFAKEISPVPEGWSRYGNTVVGAPSEEWTYLQIVVEELTGAERAVAGDDTESYTAYTSQDGVNWVRGGTWTHSLDEGAGIALAAFGLQDPGADFTAEFDYVRTSTLKESSSR
ncbi:family 43 glycosylhydrolase [Arthrobacter sp. H14]|uniref:family 43 glycosylhydrolase n=1 Tax=Arthrobacter sp. H14 TaxID=1312959 RepID=UPI0004B74D09|nr:family 43 glycosylhydrolase [Arthrobacter sp. H14]